MGKKSQKLEGITEIKSEGRAAGAVGIFTMSLKPHAWQKTVIYLFILKIIFMTKVGILS